MARPSLRACATRELRSREPIPCPPPGQRHPHAHFRCLGVDEAEAGVARGKEPEPGGTHRLLILSDDAAVPGLRPPHHVVRQLRSVHHVTDLALRAFRSPEGGCHEHLSQEGAIRSVSGANLNGHAPS